MQNFKEKGFSLIEMLVVVTIVGIVTVLSVPLYKKAINASENMSIFSITKIMVQEQTAEFSKLSRYARLPELNQTYSNNFGRTVGNTIERGKYTFTMSPVSPTDAELKENFTIIATRSIDNTDVPYVISVDASGAITQIIP